MKKVEERDEEKWAEERKATNTAFILMFPALILAGMAGLWAETLCAKFLVISLAFYQFLMLKKFIQDYYKK
jgi:hypothetical protein